MTQAVDVIVVGAGLSGLTAASEIADAGLSVNVVEARDRIGGRVRTGADKLGHPVEYGAEFVGPHQASILALADKHHLDLVPTWDEGIHLGEFGGPERRWSGDLPDIGLTNLFGTVAGMATLNALARAVPPTTPWSARVAEYLDRRSVAEWLTAVRLPREGVGLLGAAMRSIFATDLDEISLLHAVMCIRSAGGFRRYMRSSGAQQLRFVDGVATLCERLAATLPIEPVLSTPITAVTSDRSGVEVQAEGRSTRASRVVIAVPPPQAAAIAFDPPLPEGRIQHLRTARPGIVLKYHLTYTEPFWRTAGFSGKSVSTKGLVNATFDLSTDDQGVLGVFVVGGHARRLLARPPEERLDAVLADLTRRFGTQALSPIESLIHVWNEDPWSPGCFAAFQPPGGWTTNRTLPAQSHGRIHFAGTETATIFHGAMEGAVTSGHRAADEIVAVLRS